MRVLCSPCFGISLFRVSFPFSLFLGADSRSRGARAPWFVRSVDIFPSAVVSSARLYLYGFRSLLTLSASAEGGHTVQINLLHFVHLYELRIILLTFFYICAIFYLTINI